MNKFKNICLLLIVCGILSACASTGTDRRFRVISTELGMEQNDRIEADTLHRQVLERQFAEISRLEYELKELTEVLKQICTNKPELCKAETPVVLEDQ